MGPVSESEEDGATATLSITGYLTGKCRNYVGGSRQVLTCQGGGTQAWGTESQDKSCVTPAEKPTRGTEGKQGHAQPNKNNKNKKLHKMTRKPQ